MSKQIVETISDATDAVEKIYDFATKLFNKKRIKKESLFRNIMTPMHHNLSIFHKEFDQITAVLVKSEDLSHEARHRISELLQSLREQNHYLRHNTGSLAQALLDILQENKSSPFYLNALNFVRSVQEMIGIEYQDFSFRSRFEDIISELKTDDFDKDVFISFLIDQRQQVRNAFHGALQSYANCRAILELE